MKVVKEINFIAAAALAFGIMTGSSAIAGTVPAVNAASYQGLYDPISVKSGQLHSTYLPNIGLGNAHFQFDPNEHAKFDWLTNAGSNKATIKGTVVNNTDPSLKLELDFSFTFIGRDAARAPKCELGGLCNSPAYNNGATGTSDYFEYFTVDASSRILGIDGTSTEGLEIGIIQAPANNVYPMQLGFGGNNKTKGIVNGVMGDYPDPLAVFGLSVWFFMDVLSNDNDVLGLDTGLLSGHGDINIELDYPIPTPVPAALPLFGSGLALLGFMGWRRKRQNGPDGAIAA